MKIATITGPGQVGLETRPTPQAHGDLVVVKVLITPMCTEFKERRVGAPRDVLGHEAAGVVVDAGNSSRVSVGDRVVAMPFNGCGLCELCLAGDYMYCQSQRDVLAESNQEYGTAGYAQYLLKPDWLLLPVPDDIKLAHAALTCCGLGPTFTASERTGVDTLSTVLVSGCGPVGLGAIIHGAIRGARVLAVEAHPYRTKLALELGAEVVLDPREGSVPERVLELTGGRGADCAIETSGAPRTAWTLAESLRPRGRMGTVAWGNDIELPPLVPRGLEVHGCWHWDHRRFAHRMWETVRQAGPLLDLMTTHTFPLDAVADAMDLQDSGECGKVFLHPHPEEMSTLR